VAFEITEIQTKLLFFYIPQQSIFQENCIKLNYSAATDQNNIIYKPASGSNGLNKKVTAPSDCWKGWGGGGWFFLKNQSRKSVRRVFHPSNLAIFNSLQHPCYLRLSSIPFERGSSLRCSAWMWIRYKLTKGHPEHVAYRFVTRRKVATL
jgi:hypothetical protein